jgi:hypothetical protein
LAQNIKDDFAAKVYEEHARMALANRDYSNYKQCQVFICSLVRGVHFAACLMQCIFAVLAAGAVCRGALFSAQLLTAY